MGEGAEKCQRQEEGRVRQAWQDERKNARGITLSDLSDFKQEHDGSTHAQHFWLVCLWPDWRCDFEAKLKALEAS